MGNFKFTKTDIEGMFVVEPAVYGDNRGYFMETYNENDFKKAGYDLTFVQDNQSQSFKGVLRGLHLQLKYPQGKLVRVIKGEVFDVGVDLRADSPTYGKWPFNSYIWVIPHDSPFIFTMVKFCAFVYKFSFIRQYDKTMSKFRRYV